MSTIVGVKTFLATGHFGPVTGSLARDEVRTLLGPPDEIMCVPKDQEARVVRDGNGAATFIPPKYLPNANQAKVWKYGSFEFHFDDRGRTWMVFADHFTDLEGGSRLRLEPWRLRGAAPRAEVEAAMTALGIAFERRSLEYDPTQLIVRTSGGVELSFIEQEEPHFPPLGLWAITRRWASDHSPK